MKNILLDIFTRCDFLDLEGVFKSNSNQNETFFTFQTIYSDENISMPGEIDRNVYIPTGIYKVRPY